MKIRLTKKNQVLLKPRINTKLHGFKLFLLATVISIGFSTANAQNAKVSISQQGISIKDVLQRIEKQTTYLFVYNSSEINLDKKVNVNMKNTSVKDVLTNILQEQHLSFYQEGNNIVLQKSQQQDKAVKKQISGVVKDNAGETLIGASVTVKGLKVGTVTDIDGNYSLSVPVGSMIEVTYMGYVTQTASITDKNNYDFILLENSKELDAVVVTALGIKRSEKALSYNVQEFKQDDITTVKDANFINALNGKVAGVNINASSSGVGGASKVVMRGPKSILQSSNVLYVVDGVPMYNLGGSGGTEFSSGGTSEAIADLNPEDIESVSVLSGAAASALYGNDAANGVIMITTQKGKTGKVSLTVSQSTDFLNPFVLPKFQNRYGTGSLVFGEGAKDRSWGARLNSYNHMGYSPKHDFYETGIVATESISLSTGTDKNQSYLSAAAVNSQGMVPNNSYDRYNFSFRNTTKFLNDKMTLDAGFSYINQVDNNMINQGVYSNPILTAYLFPRGNDWGDVEMYEIYKTERKISEQNWNHGITEYDGQNPYWIAYRNLRKNKKNRYLANASISYDILDWLNVSGRAKIDYTSTTFTDKKFASTNTTLVEGSTNGYYGKQSINDRQTYADLLANINKQFSENFSLQANIGASYSDIKQNILEIAGPLREDGIPNKFAIVQLDKNKDIIYQELGFRDQTQSIFASVELGYKGAYYLTLTGRNDWPSQLAGHSSTQSSFFYHSIGTSFVLTEIFKMPKQINYAKFRASYAEVGTPFQRGLGAIRAKSNEWNRALGIYKASTTYPMTSLKPERTATWELGLTSRFLNHFNLDLTLYTSDTKNQTFNIEISTGSRYKDMYLQTGKVRNKGIEFGLGYDNKWGNFGWATYYTFSANKNEILELAENWYNPISQQRENIDQLNIGGLDYATFYLRKGGSLGDLYSTMDVRRDDRGNVYIDEKGQVATVNVSEGLEPIKLGNTLPKSNMSWKNDFSWKNFNLGLLVTARFGGVVYSATQAIMDRYGVSEASALSRDRGGVVINDGTFVNPENWYTVIGANAGMPQYYTYSATNVRLQEASLSYTFTKDKLWGIGDATISLIGRNLLMFYNKAPFDPESVATTGNFYQGIDYFMVPSSRNVGFSVRLKF